MGHREDQSSRRRCDLDLNWRHFQKAAMILVEINPIDLYFKSIIDLLGKVFVTRVEAGDFRGGQGTPE